MPSYSEEYLSPHAPAQLFGLVADIERYPEFLPWCIAARIHSRTPGKAIAELVIGFKGLREAYVSEVTFDPQAEEKSGKIEVKLVRGPFRHLYNRWDFLPAPGGGTLIRFHIEFAFRSSLFEKMAGRLFESATKKMVAAFEERADKLYGH